MNPLDMLEEHQIGGQSYRFKKMLGMDALAAWEGIRPGFASVVDSVNVPNVVERIGEMGETPEAEAARQGDRNAQGVLMGQVLDVVLKIVFSVPPSAIAVARNRLFRNVYWYNEPRGEWQVVAADENLCFQNTDVIDIYKVLGRAFWQNFQGSLRQLPVLGGILDLILSEEPAASEEEDEALVVPTSLQTPPGSLSATAPSDPDELPTSLEDRLKPSS